MSDLNMLDLIKCRTYDKLGLSKVHKYERIRSSYLAINFFNVLSRCGCIVVFVSAHKAVEYNLKGSFISLFAF